MLSSQVIEKTLERFPTYTADHFSVVPLEKGGSGRKFYRVFGREGGSMIVVKYTNHRAENRHYVDIAEFLAREKIQVPRIDFHDSVEGLIWMQDLGEDDLWAHRENSWEDRRPLYEAALREAGKLHAVDLRREDVAQLELQHEFGEPLYLWEQTYFFENCLQAHFGLAAETVRRQAESPVLRDILSHLAAQPKVLVHRDFQSQNVLTQGAGAWLIDFQGMRPGLAQYDVASLLYDPYVNLTTGEREELLGFYKQECGPPGKMVSPDFDDVFYRCALQRLMQALGAYGFLGLQQGRPEFLAYIPAALRSLREVATRIDGLNELTTLLDDLP
jgi:N-acetylmuramate 1-kinase